MLTRLGLSRSVLAASLVALQEAGWLIRNPGHGHPLRPEYLLSPTGEPVAAFCQGVMAQRERLGLAHGQLPRWSLPLLLAARSGDGAFLGAAHGAAPGHAARAVAHPEADAPDRSGRPRAGGRVPADRDLRPDRARAGAGFGDALNEIPPPGGCRTGRLRAGVPERGDLIGVRPARAGRSSGSRGRYCRNWARSPSRRHGSPRTARACRCRRSARYSRSPDSPARPRPRGRGSRAGRARPSPRSRDG